MSERDMERADKISQEAEKLRREHGYKLEAVIVQLIAQALQEERERVCQIIENWTPPFPLSSEDIDRTLARNLIMAAAIRKSGEA